MAPLSIIIPTLNAVPVLGPTLAALAQIESAGLVRELIIADGGSTDETRQAAREAGAVLVDSPPGRGSQLRAGAESAHGDWLLFLHADTVLSEGWSDAVRTFIADEDKAVERSDPQRLCAGYFKFALDDPSPQARRVERLVGWRNRVLALPYGDQGLLMPKALYEQVGGYRAVTLMEDVEIVRRIGRRRLQLIDMPAVTSATRYRRDGYWRRPARNILCLALYYLGLPRPLIHRIYG